MYVTPWRGGIEETMVALQNELLATHFTYLPPADRPTDLAVLWSGDERDEDSWAGFMGTQGTHTILDIRRVVPPEARVDALFGTMRPVPVDEIVEAFGHPLPTREEFEQLERLEDSPLLDDDGRWTGRCIVLWAADGDGRGDADAHDGPEWVAFWGSSGD